MDVVIVSLLVAFITVLLLIFYTRGNKQNNENQTQVKRIPGIGIKESKDGALVLGMFGLFLRDLHNRFGPVVSFYQEKTYAVSVADPNLLKSLRHLEIIPVEIFTQFEVLFGTESFTFQELEEIRRRRKLYDHHFMLKACKSYSACFVQIAEEYAEKWKKLSKDDQIPLLETASEATMKGILRTNYGDYFKDEQSLKRFQQLFVKISKALEKDLKSNSTDLKEAQTDLSEIKKTVTKILTQRQQDTSDTDKNLFIDVLLEDNQSSEAQLSDSIVFIMGGYEITGRLIMWVIYELCRQPKLQEKLYEELKSVLGDQQVTLEKLPKLQYLSQVVDETIRFRGDTIFNLRIVQEELKLGDFVIPANTKLFMNTGYSFLDKKYFANPDKFDPDHFSPQITRTRHAFAWKPFGFAGKRQCPGQSYARTKISIFLAEWIRKFQFKLAPNQDIKFVLGMMLRPESDIFITLESRN